MAKALTQSSPFVWTIYWLVWPWHQTTLSQHKIILKIIRRLSGTYNNSRDAFQIPATVTGKCWYKRALCAIRQWQELWTSMQKTDLLVHEWRMNGWTHASLHGNRATETHYLLFILKRLHLKFLLDLGGYLDYAFFLSFLEIFVISQNWVHSTQWLKRLVCLFAIHHNHSMINGTYSYNSMTRCLYESCLFLSIDINCLFLFSSLWSLNVKFWNTTGERKRAVWFVSLTAVWGNQWIQLSASIYCQMAKVDHVVFRSAFKNIGIMFFGWKRLSILTKRWLRGHRFTFFFYADRSTSCDRGYFDLVLLQ